MLSKRPAPAGAPGLLLVAPLMATFLALSATVAGMMVVPLCDPTPSVVLVLCLFARRWEGTRTRLLDAAAGLAGIITIEWVVAYGFLVYALISASSVQQQGIVSALGAVWLFYVLELGALLALFGVACMSSRSSLLGLTASREMTGQRGTRTGGKLEDAE